MPTFARSTKICFRINGQLTQNIELDSRILEWFCGNHNKVVSTHKTKIAVYVQLYLEDYGNQLFQATPNYLGTGPWYD
jgi:hypothetical protein